MEMTETMNEIAMERLSAKALALISEFALILYRLEGTVIDVHADDILRHVFAIGRKSRNARLRAIYLHIRTELVMNATKSRPAKNVVPFDTALPAVNDFASTGLQHKLS